MMILCDGGGFGWRHAGFGVNFRIPLRQLGWWVVHRPAQVGQQPQPGGGHGEPAPPGRGAVEHRPHQLEAGVLAGQPTDDLDPAPSLAEGALDEVRVPHPGPVLTREPQVHRQRVAIVEQAPHSRRIRVAPTLFEHIEPLLHVRDRVAARLDRGSQRITWAPAQAVPVPADYDGDGLTDFALKGSNGVWYIDMAACSGGRCLGADGFGGRCDFAYPGYGDATAIPVPADYVSGTIMSPRRPKSGTM
jgi:hypothetical protein